LVYLFGGFIVASGLINLLVGLTNLTGGGNTLWGRILLILLGIGETAVGVYLLRHPGVSFATFILVIGLVLIVRGVIELFSGIFGEGGPMYKTVNIIGGLLAAVVGIILLFQPVEGGVAFVWVLGLYALITGPLVLAFAFEAKEEAKALEAGAARPVRAPRARR
jgi:uncharacterized membrane protein HdeD (DUF308 family)